MRPGLIAKILEYHYSNEEYAENLHEAFCRFFNKKPGDFFQPSVEDMAIFSEWLIFDYILPGGKTLLKNYIKENIDNISKKELSECNDLLDSTFSIFEILESWPGKGLKFVDLFSRKEYIVKEKTGSQGLSRGDTAFFRVGRVGYGWEIVSAKLNFYPSLHIDQNLVEFWKKDKEKINPKFMYDLVNLSILPKKNKEGFFGKDFGELDPEKAKKDFELFLKKYGLDKFCDSHLVQKWIYGLGEKGNVFKNFNEVAAVFMGLTNHLDNADEVRDELVPVLNNFYNISPQSKLSGKSPNNKAKERKNKSLKSRIISSARAYSFDGLSDFNSGINFMKDKNYEMAMESIKQGFQKLLKEKMVFSDPYRPFANLAVCHLAQEKWMEAEILLELALDLNPNYGFSRSTLERYKKTVVFKDTKNIMKLFRGMAERKLEKHPVLKYYNFLKKTGINFTTDESTKDKISIPGESKIGRNDPCPCNSGKKFKRCCGA